MIKDTLIDPGTITERYVGNYGYTGNNILIREYDSIGNAQTFNIFTDSMVVDAGNLTKDISTGGNYAINQSGTLVELSSFSGNNSLYSYNDLGNPLYNAQVSNSLGPLLRHFSLGDFISKNLISQGPGLLDAGATPYTLSFSWTAVPGASVKTIFGLGANVGSQVYERVTFHLK